MEDKKETSKLKDVKRVPAHGIDFEYVMEPEKDKKEKE